MRSRNTTLMSTFGNANIRFLYVIMQLNSRKVSFASLFGNLRGCDQQDILKRCLLVYSFGVMGWGKTFGDLIFR